MPSPLNIEGIQRLYCTQLPMFMLSKISFPKRMGKNNSIKYELGLSLFFWGGVACNSHRYALRCTTQTQLVQASVFTLLSIHNE